MKIESKNAAVYLFGYDESMYSAQSVISGLSTFVGALGVLFAFLGLVIPSGKLIIIEALGVIQLSYFSVLQFQKIPPTYIGFKNLIISNGLNDQQFVSESGSTAHNIYKLMGLETSALSNFNVSLMLFIFMPALIGGIGLLVIKYTSKAAR